MTPNHMTQMHNPLHPGEFIEGVYQEPRWMLNAVVKADSSVLRGSARATQKQLKSRFDDIRHTAWLDLVHEVVLLESGEECPTHCRTGALLRGGCGRH